MNSFYLTVAEQVLAQVSFEPLRNRSVLITGTNGLLGSHMLAAIAHANRKLDLNAKVTAISRGAPASWIGEVIKTAGFQFIQKDLSHGLGSEELKEFDYVIHAATYGQPKKFLSDPLATMKLNADLTAQLLEVAARKQGSFLFMSSSEIYGNPPQQFMPLTEDYPGNVSPLDHRAPYTSSKRYGETLCKVYNDQAKVRARIARVSSAYGPGVHLIDDRVLNVFIRRAIESGKLTMMDQGLQTRRWLYISDAITMLFHILLHSKEIVYNVSGSDLRSIAEMADFIAAGTGVQVILPEALLTANHTQGAPDVIDLDNSKIVRAAGMKSLVPLSEGISACIAWTRSLMERSA